MNSTALYKAFIEVGASEDRATTAAEDIVQVSQLSDLATKSDVAKLEADIEKTELALKTAIEKTELALRTEIADLRTDMRERENRLIRWMVGCALACVSLAVAGVGIVFQVMLSPGVIQ